MSSSGNLGFFCGKSTMISIEKDFSWIAPRLEKHEGCVLSPYKCTAGKLTIGIGHNCEAREFTPEEKKAIGDWRHGITRNAALMLLRNDVKICLKRLAGLDFFPNLDSERQYALLDMCFQLGYGELCCFSDMLEAMRAGDWEAAASECLNSRYARQTPKRAKRIATLIRTGKWE